MTSLNSPADAAGVLGGVRAEVRATPDYPFTPVHAPVKLDQNESALDFPRHLRELAVRRMLERDWNRYPDLHAETLKEKIGAYEDWDAAGVVVTPGSNVIIKLLTELGGIGQRILTVQPNFSVYELEGQMLGATLTRVPLRADFGLDVAAMKRELATGGPGVLFLPQPHAPTGFLDEESDVRAVVEAAGDDWIVVIDEAYHQYSGSDYRSLVLERGNRLSLRTFSKAWGLAGLRLGYALTHPALAANLQKLVSAFNVNVLTQVVAEVALEHPQYVRERADEVIWERGRVQNALSGLKVLHALPSRTNFFLVRTPDPSAAYAFLLERGLLVRRQDKQPMLTGCLRVSIGTREQNDALVAALLELDRELEVRE
ncbi:histidinol-phosphate aminotransferase family protein [Deinococcus sp. KNUC1210]|uniref:pyridoxal phosphate-dependent aminotransferase n=1 Tax=Deinococcus sp. KNUC1210 TaxID=2917691 RepID=UPI001EF0A595|nr:histidinol-phosphate transaminase [Deinococcus sp. KNUC1210]ULH16518.1 histidinol-phosphate aminotransferase family protein [Deinococcus sp. KNUC1210]